MQFFKSKALKKVLSLIVLIVFLLTGNAVLGEVLTPISYAAYFNHDIEKIEESNSEVDLLFIGASRVYRTFWPEAFENTLDMKNVLNAGSSAQPLGATYYQLLDLVERVHPKNVVIGVVWNGLRAGNDQQSMLIVYDRISLKQKVGLVLNCFEDENYVYTNYAYRFRNNLEKIPSIYRAKQELVENQYIQDTTGNEYYEDKGFVYSNNSCISGNLKLGYNSWSEEKDVDAEKVEYLDACIELCKENDINVWLVTAPTSLARTYSIENYQDAVDFYKNYAEEKGVKYHNLNYLKNREDFLPDTLMHDINHVNGEGGHIVSEIYAEILAKEMAGVDTSDYFYSDLDELKANVHRIVAVSGAITVTDTEKRTAVIEFDSLKNEDMDAYYQALVSFDGGGTWDVLVDWTQEESAEITLPDAEYYLMKVSARSQADGDIDAYQYY